MRMLRPLCAHWAMSIRVRNWCAPWPYASNPYVHAQHAHQFSHFSNVHFVYPQHVRKERMRALSLRVRNWCVHWAYTSGTNACTEHSPFKKSWAYMHQELMRTLSIQSGTNVPWAYTSGTDSYPEHTHQFLQFLRRMLSISVKITKFEKILSKILRMRGRNWCMHWACVSGTDACTELKRQELMCTLSMQYPNVGS